MGLYNFQQRFVGAVLSGRKNHTIRAHRKHPDKPGDTMHLYTGLRTKKARLLMRRPCVKVEEILIEEICSTQIYVDGVELDLAERNRLARADGFDSFEQMKEFWKGRLPFKGQIIHWQPRAKPETPE
jgi:uncharacterized protein YqfB (UPF0267 family)